MTRLQYLMDTDVCIDIIRSKSDSIMRKVCAQELEQLSVSTVTIAELEVGVAKSSKSEQAAIALSQFLQPMRVRDFDARAARTYGIIRAKLERAGQRIGILDMFIAAQALTDNLVLITNNYREFKRVEGLCTESWYELDYSERTLEKQ